MNKLTQQEIINTFSVIIRSRIKRYDCTNCDTHECCINIDTREKIEYVRNYLLTKNSSWGWFSHHQNIQPKIINIYNELKNDDCYEITQLIQILNFSNYTLSNNFSAFLMEFVRKYWINFNTNTSCNPNLDPIIEEMLKHHNNLLKSSFTEKRIRYTIDESFRDLIISRTQIDVTLVESLCYVKNKKHVDVALEYLNNYKGKLIGDCLKNVALTYPTSKKLLPFILKRKFSDRKLFLINMRFCIEKLLSQNKLDKAMKYALRYGDCTLVPLCGITDPIFCRKFTDHIDEYTGKIHSMCLYNAFINLPKTYYLVEALMRKHATLPAIEFEKIIIKYSHKLNILEYAIKYYTQEGGQLLYQHLKDTLKKTFGGYTSKMRFCGRYKIKLSEFDMCIENIHTNNINLINLFLKYGYKPTYNDICNIVKEYNINIPNTENYVNITRDLVYQYWKALVAPDFDMTHLGIDREQFKLEILCTRGYVNNIKAYLLEYHKRPSSFALAMISRTHKHTVIKQLIERGAIVTKFCMDQCLFYVYPISKQQIPLDPRIVTTVSMCLTLYMDACETNDKDAHKLYINALAEINKIKRKRIRVSMIILLNGYHEQQTASEPSIEIPTPPPLPRWNTKIIELNDDIPTEKRVPICVRPEVLQMIETKKNKLTFLDMRKLIVSYIVQNNIQVKSIIHPDLEMQKVFDFKENEAITFNQLDHLIAKCFKVNS